MSTWCAAECAFIVVPGVLLKTGFQYSGEL